MIALLAFLVATAIVFADRISRPALLTIYAVVALAVAAQLIGDPDMADTDTVIPFCALHGLDGLDPGSPHVRCKVLSLIATRIADAAPDAISGIVVYRWMMVALLAASLLFGMLTVQRLTQSTAAALLVPAAAAAAPSITWVARSFDDNLFELFAVSGLAWALTGKASRSAARAGLFIGFGLLSHLELLPVLGAAFAVVVFRNRARGALEAALAALSTVVLFEVMAQALMPGVRGYFEAALLGMSDMDRALDGEGYMANFVGKPGYWNHVTWFLFPRYAQRLLVPLFGAAAAAGLLFGRDRKRALVLIVLGAAGFVFPAVYEHEVWERWTAASWCFTLLAVCGVATLCPRAERWRGAFAFAVLAAFLFHPAWEAPAAGGFGWSDTPYATVPSRSYVERIDRMLAGETIAFRSQTRYRGWLYAKHRFGASFGCRWVQTPGEAAGAFVPNRLAWEWKLDARINEFPGWARTAAKEIAVLPGDGLTLVAARRVPGNAGTSSREMP